MIFAWRGLGLIYIAVKQKVQMSLSPKISENARQAATLLKSASASLPVLRNVAWDAEHRTAFLSSGAQNLPNVSYPNLDLQTARSEISAAIDKVEGEHPVLDWLRRTARTLSITASMLESRGTAEFFTHSAAIYGTPQKLMLDGKTKVLEMAQHIDGTLAVHNLSHLVRDGADEALSAQGFADALRPKLAKHFGDDAPSVELSKTLSAKATAGSRRIRVRADADFTQMDVAQLLQHEALVHTATALNGRRQPHFALLGSAHPGTTQIQEGLAVFAEMIAGTMDPSRFRRLADRVIAIEMAIEGADFIQVYRFFLERTDDLEQSYENTRRVFRGGLVQGGAPFTKDLVYLNGLLRVHNFLRTVVKLGRADLIRLLFVGKLDLEDVPALAMLSDAGELRAPEFMPPWAADLRFLVSYLTYSSFLNRIKLPGFKNYYEERLKDVPNLWERL